MVFNDLSTTKQGIVPDTYFLLFGDSGDHTTDYPLADIARNVNRWYDKVVTKILQADYRWEWDDTNKTDLPIANIDLVANQEDYGITAATFLKVSRVDCKDSAGNGINLQQFFHTQLKGTALSEYQKTAGIPRFYRLQASSIFLYPKPDYAYTKGLRIFYQRNVDYFVSTATTKVPGFAEMFHRILSLGAAYEYALINGLTAKMSLFRNEIAVMENDIVDFYSSRNHDKQSLSFTRTDYGESIL